LAARASHSRRSIARLLLLSLSGFDTGQDPIQLHYTLRSSDSHRLSSPDHRAQLVDYRYATSTPIGLLKIFRQAGRFSRSGASEPSLCRPSTAITAERYGYIDRAHPGADLDGFVDTLARRIASFARRAIAAAKISLTKSPCLRPDRLLDALNSFQTALM
jgi:hypothetical protein